jgi:hypothetical protein
VSEKEYVIKNEKLLNYKNEVGQQQNQVFYSLVIIFWIFVQPFVLTLAINIAYNTMV